MPNPIVQPGQSMWDYWCKQITFLQWHDEYELNNCELCRKPKPDGKLFWTSETDKQFICDACWLQLTLKMLDQPGPDTLLPSQLPTMELEVPEDFDINNLDEYLKGLE